MARDDTGSRLHARIVQRDDQTHIELGWLVKSIMTFGALGAIGTIATIVLGYPSLAEDVEENTAAIEQIESALRKAQRNQIKIDERLRRQEAGQTWANSKLDALLEAGGVNKRIPQPSVPESTLEPAS